VSDTADTRKQPRLTILTTLLSEMSDKEVAGEAGRGCRVYFSDKSDRQVSQMSDAHTAFYWSSGAKLRLTGSAAIVHGTARALSDISPCACEIQFYFQSCS
jgi:hypothetical protein